MKRPRDLDARLAALRSKLPERDPTVAETIAEFLLLQEAAESGEEVIRRGSPAYLELVEEVRAILVREGDDPDEPASNYHSKP